MRHVAAAVSQGANKPDLARGRAARRGRSTYPRVAAVPPAPARVTGSRPGAINKCPTRDRACEAPGGGRGDPHGVCAPEREALQACGRGTPSGAHPSLKAKQPRASAGGGNRPGLLPLRAARCPGGPSSASSKPARWPSPPMAGGRGCPAHVCVARVARPASRAHGGQVMAGLASSALAACGGPQACGKPGRARRASSARARAASPGHSTALPSATRP